MTNNKKENTPQVQTPNNQAVKTKVNKMSLHKNHIQKIQM